MVKRADSLMRTIHLVLGTLVLAFLLLYALSGVQMAFVPFRWTTVAQADVPVTPESISNPRLLGRHIMQARQIQGEIKTATENADGFAVTIAWPGTEHQVTWRRGEAIAQVRTRVVGLVGMLNRLHQLDGLWHESWLLNVWGVFVGLTSLALFGLGVTGLWLWFRVHEERVVGGVLLAGGLVVGLGLILLIRGQT